MTDYDIARKLWVSKQITTSAELSEALNGQSILFAYHSGKIENDNITYHDTREIFERDGVTSYTGDLRTLFEIRNAKEAYGYFLDAFEQRVPLGEELILNMQFYLTQNTYDTRQWQLGERPGTFKQHDYITGQEEVGAAPEDVREELGKLFSELQIDIDDDNVIKAAAYFHAKFENIHLFADGNGRTGRLATNYFLVTHDHPPITFYEENRREYFSCLEEWDRNQQLQPLVDFLVFQTEKTWQKQIDKNRGQII